MSIINGVGYRINTEYGIYIINYLRSCVENKVLSLTLHFPSKIKTDKKACHGFICIEDTGKILFYSAQTFNQRRDRIECKTLMELYIHIAGTHTVVSTEALTTLISEAKRHGCKIIE